MKVGKIDSDVSIFDMEYKIHGSENRGIRDNSQNNNYIIEE